MYAFSQENMVIEAPFSSYKVEEKFIGYCRLINNILVNEEHILDVSST